MRTRLAVASLLLLPALVFAAPPPDTGLSGGIAPAELEAHVRYLAGDALAGRRAGEAGARQAAAWVADRFAEAGLEPAGDDGTFRQSFALPNRDLDAGRCSLALKPATGEAVSFAPGADWLVFGNAADASLADLPIVFVGYGIRAPDLGRDDYAGLDVAGKAVLVLRHGPGEGRPDFPYRGRRMIHLTFEEKARNAAAAGAAAVILVNDRGHHPEEPDALAPAPLSKKLGIPFVFAKAALARAAFAAAGRDLDAAAAEIERTGGSGARPLDGIRLNLTVATTEVRTENVVGRLSGSDPELANEVVVLGAHYDHIGTDGAGALDPAAGGAIRNGADDNASGTAALIELAEHFALAAPRPKRTLLFVAFSAEELGLLGSRHYVEHPAVPLDRTVAMLNMDMIGRSEKGFLFVGGVGTSPVFDDLLTAAADGLDLSIRRGEGGAAPSDNTSFFVKGIPTLFFFTGLHADYHRATDDWDRLHYDTEAKIATLVARIARAVADRPVRPEFVAARGGGFAAGPPGPYLGVRLGGDDGPGAALAGVMPDTPAATAGLKAGDRIVRMDGKPVADAAALVAGLRGREPGDEVVLGVRRGDGEVEVRVTLGER